MLPSPATSILLHRDSGLLAVICDDFVVRIVDIETRRIVRELKGFRGRILDVVRDLLLLRTLSVTQEAVDFLSRLPLASRSMSGLYHSHVRYPHRAIDRRVQNTKCRY